MTADPGLAAAVRALPIFPLPEIVLFPGALLPLHIFEPRYRTMTADVLAARPRVLAMARLIGREEEGAPPPLVDAVVGVGEVISHEKLPDGRANILVRGVARARIEEELAPERPYRLVRAHLLQDEGQPAEELDSAVQQLIAVCDALAVALPEGGDMLRQLVRSVPDPGLCADVVGAAVLIDSDARQALLETLDPLRRLEVVIEQASQLLQRFRFGRQPN